jgi:hypothetical protein
VWNCAKSLVSNEDNLLSNLIIKIMKKNKKERNILFLFILIVTLVIIILFFYFNNLIKKERLEAKKDFERIILESGGIPDNLLDNKEQTSQETLNRLREDRIARYFLSEVELINNLYTPIIHICLHETGVPIYSSYIYETWSLLDYPKDKPEIALIRYLLLPEDNDNFKPNESCYIKEIESENDWKEIEKYNFYEYLFI